MVECQFGRKVGVQTKGSFRPHLTHGDILTRFRPGHVLRTYLKHLRNLTVTSRTLSKLKTPLVNTNSFHKMSQMVLIHHNQEKKWLSLRKDRE